MIVKMFAMYDTKAQAYLQPFFCQSKGVAIRSLTEAVNDKASNYGKYPEDFTLFELGDWEDSTGKFIVLPSPCAIVNAIELLSPVLLQP